MTDRTLTAAVSTETEQNDYRMALFVELEFDTDPVYVWTGVGTLTYTMPTVGVYGGVSRDWVGVGDLGGMDGIAESSDRSQNGVRLHMTGIDNDLLSNALTQDYQGRTAVIWLVYFDDAGAIVADPFVVFGGEMDVIEVIEGDERGTVFVYCESLDGKLRRKSETLLTNEEQQRLYPGDLGLEFVADLQSREILWGKEGAPINGPGSGGILGPNWRPPSFF